MRRRVVLFEGSRDSCSGSILICPGDTEQGSRCHSLLAHARTDVGTGRGSGHHVPIATESLARRRETGEGQEVRLQGSAEAECAPKNRSTAKYLSGGQGRVFARIDSSPQGGVKRSADRLPTGLRATHSGLKR